MGLIDMSQFDRMQIAGDPPRMYLGPVPGSRSATGSVAADLVHRYFELAPRHDPGPFLAQFAHDAVLEDDGDEHRGAAAVEAWYRGSPPVAYTVHDVTPNGGGHEARVEIAGDFPGSPVALTHHFTFIDDEHVATLRIHP
jgi:hypothetical protein